MTDRIERDILIDAPVGRVWDVLTGPSHMPGWFSGASATIDLRLGGRIEFHWKEHGTFHATIEQLDAPVAFSFRWALTADEAPVAGNATLVEFTLTAEGPGTRLRVVESGFDTLAGSEASREEHRSNNVEGWAAALTGIQAYAARRESASGG
jgi:uncharacterized protein YndB with AHSA1/START domain